MEEGTAIPMTFDKCFFDAKKREEEEKEAAVQNAKEQKEHMMKHLVLGERRTNLNEIKI